MGSQEGDGEAEAAEIVGISGGGAHRAARRTPRGCVQKKINFYLPTRGGGCDGGGDEEEDGESSWSGEEEKRKPKRKVQTGTANKVDFFELAFSIHTSVMFIDVYFHSTSSDIIVQIFFIRTVENVT